MSNVLEIIGLVLRVIWGYITQAVGKMSWTDIVEVFIVVLVVVVIGMLLRRIGAFFLAMMTLISLASLSADVGTERAPAPIVQDNNGNPEPSNDGSLASPMV